MTDAPETDTDNLANSLFAALTAGTDFTLPAVDLEDVDFAIPDPAGNPHYAAVTPLTEAALTDRTVGGTGLFDGMMEALSKHLQQEYEKGRISGNDYATSYVALTQSALSASVQYLLSKDNAYYQALLVQKQAQAAEIEVIRGRLAIEVSRAQLAAARIETNTAAAGYALTKLKLATEDASIQLTEAQTTKAEYEVGSLMPAQLGQITKQTAVADYELVNILPKEALRVQSQVDTATAQISHITAQKDQVLYQTSAILPAQKDNIDSDRSIKEYQHLTFLPAQVAGFTADTVGKTYNNDFILPAQLTSIKEQMEAHRARTLDTRSDGVTPVAGATGRQNALHEQQVVSYQRDAEAKVAKMFIDTWITQKSLDDGLAPPDSLTDANINTVMDKVRTNLSLE